MSQEIDCEAKSRSKVRMQRETDQKTAESINGTGRSGETTNKQKSLEVEEE